MIKKRCNTCIKYEAINTLCEKCKELNEFDALMSGDAIELPKIDMGQAVTPEEKQGLTDNALIHHGEKEEFKVRVNYPNPVLVRKLAKERTVEQAMGDEPIPNDLAANRGLDGYNS